MPADAGKAPGVTVVRWASGERLGDILTLIHDAFGGLEPPSSVLTETVEDIKRRQRDGVVLVAQVDGAFAGSLFCEVKHGGFYLTRMAVAPARQKRGIGRLLMAAAEAEARSRGLSRLTLRVRTSLPDNLAYFSTLGFTVTGRGQDPGRAPYVTMERALGDTVRSS